jgi:hypothetical protein
LNAGDYDKRTCLHLAAGAGNIEIVRFLIGEGANVNPRDRWGATPLNDAKDRAVIDYLLANGAEKGVDVECGEAHKVVITDDGFRLYFAACYNDILMMQSLCVLGAKFNL